MSIWGKEGGGVITQGMCAAGMYCLFTFLHAPSTPPPPSYWIHHWKITLWEGMLWHQEGGAVLYTTPYTHHTNPKTGAQSPPPPLLGWWQDRTLINLPYTKTGRGGLPSLPTQGWIGCNWLNFKGYPNLSQDPSLPDILIKNHKTCIEPYMISRTDVFFVSYF